MVKPLDRPTLIMPWPGRVSVSATSCMSTPREGSSGLSMMRSPGAAGASWNFRGPSLPLSPGADTRPGRSGLGGLLLLEGHDVAVDLDVVPVGIAKVEGAVAAAVVE